MRRSDSDIKGKPLDDSFRILHEFTRAPVESPVARVLREGVIVGLAEHTVLVRGDASEVPIDDSAAPIKQDGRTIGAVLVFRDVSERRRAQRESAYLAAIVESSDDAIIGTSPDGTIQSWNNGAERLYGFRAEEITGRPLSDLFPAERRREQSDILERLSSGEHVVHFETVRVRKDGAAIDVSLTISPIRDRNGQIVGISQVARDITEQKRHAEQLRQTQKLESLGVLAGGIAHDFNNLLTGILGNASLILEDLPPGSPLRSPAEVVVEATERAARLARQMLAYSGKGQFVLESVDLSAQVRDTLPLIKAAIPPGVELELNLADELPPIEADATQIQQVIMNIIINAAESIPEGKPGAVAISTRLETVSGDAAERDGGGSELTPGAYNVLEVRDNGSGMSEETRARIFDPFFTTKFTGRGLGLSAVLGTVRGHHGSIQVSSALGKGTVFRVFLPASDATPESKTPEPKVGAVDLRGKGLILVVDDEPFVRGAAREALERYGYTVLVAEDGERGLEVLRREANRIDCVVLDLTMPGMSGEETLARMKAIDDSVPIMLSSGFNEVQAVERFHGKGLAGFLQKPYRAQSLVEKIKALMRR
jgi:PAS domain S-box-containing protein